jgi:hypothetical protein
MKIHRTEEESETIYRLLRQAISVTEAVAQPEYPFTSYLLRIALSALEEEMIAAIKAQAESDMQHYT